MLSLISLIIAGKKNYNEEEIAKPLRSTTKMRSTVRSGRSDRSGIRKRHRTKNLTPKAKRHSTGEIYAGSNTPSQQKKHGFSYNITSEQSHGKNTDETSSKPVILGMVPHKMKIN